MATLLTIYSGRMKDANAAITLLKNDLKKNQALNRIRTHDLCVTGAMLYQLSYQSHIRTVTFGFGPLIMFSGRNTRLKYMNFIVIGGHLLP